MRGFIQCPECEGAKSHVCTDCEGVGTIEVGHPDAFYHDEDCSRCEGAGTIPCKECNSTGWVEE